MCPGGAKIKPPFEMGVSDLECEVTPLLDEKMSDERGFYVSMRCRVKTKNL